MTNTIKLSLAAVIAVAGLTSTAAADVKISGDAAIKYEMQKDAADSKTDFIDTEVNLDFTATNTDNVSLHVGVSVYEGDQAGTVEDGNFDTAYAYIKTALPVGEKTVLKAGLVPNGPFGNGPILGGVAFESGGESWKTNVDTMVGDFKVTVGRATLEEGRAPGQDDITKDYVKVQNNAGAIKYGIQYASTTNQDASTTKTALNPFVNGEVSGIGFAAEFKQNGSDADGSGFFVEAGKTMGPLTAGVAYFSLTEGMKIGSDFDLDITDGDDLVSNAAEDTSFLVVPV
jgi:hypothetical protein